MPGVRFSIEIGRPPAEVFAVLADFANDTRWRANIVEMIPLGTASDPLGGVWSRQVEVRQVPGRQLRTEAVVTAFEPPRLIAFQRASGPIRPAGAYRIAASGAGSRLDFTLDVELSGARILLAPMVMLMLGALIRPALPRDFGRVKALLEAGNR